MLNVKEEGIAVGISVFREEAEDLLARCEMFLDELKSYLESLET